MTLSIHSIVEITGLIKFQIRHYNNSYSYESNVGRVETFISDGELSVLVNGKFVSKNKVDNDFTDQTIILIIEGIQKSILDWSKCQNKNA